ncbi:hypothetical protein FRB97_000060 [Tulasnella sp. 331]|nr:hypothetical protein FRB97_000060 [Tulasnella sp. 331]
MPSITSIIQLAAFLTVAVAVPTPVDGELLERATGTDTAKRTTCTVNSVASAADLSGCSAVIITAFTVPAGETITLSAASGATITQTGDITFAYTTATGPLITFDTDNVLYNGGDHNINVGRPRSLFEEKLSQHLNRVMGLSTGMDKVPMEASLSRTPLSSASGFVSARPPSVLTTNYRFKGYGTFEYVTVLNSPAQAISVGTTGTTVIESITVDNSAGNTDSLGANTDGFDISASDVTLSKNVVTNQDDCVAINSGSTIIIEDMTCTGSHGISIGSIASDKTVSGVKIARNTITGGLYGLRIKVMQVDSDATDASVSDVIYEENVISGITEYGVLITQSYPDNDGTPGTGAPITDINFTGGTTTVSVDSDAYTLVIDCGACSGTWDFVDLDATGGKGHIIAANDATISGGTY